MSASKLELLCVRTQHIPPFGRSRKMKEKILINNSQNLPKFIIINRNYDIIQ